MVKTIKTTHCRIIKPNYKTIYLLSFLAFTLTIILLFFPYSITTPLKYLHLISSDTSQFLIQSDYVQQYIPFYEEFFRLVDNGAIGWSSNEMFGINFFASKAYYCIGDLFAWLMYGLRYFISDTIDLLLLVTLFKLIVAGFSFEYLLSQFSVKPSLRILYAILYIGSGWMTIFIEQPVFISFYALAPLFIASIIKTAKMQRPNWLLPISAAVCIMTQYYLTWMLCILIFIGWIIYHGVNHIEFKRFFNLSFHTFSYFLIGVGIAAPIWLPSIFHMIQNPRLGGSELNTYWLYDWKDLLNIVKNAYLPVLKYSDHAYRSYWYYFYQTGIYAGLLNTLILPLFFVNQSIDGKTKKGFGLFFIVLLFTLVSPQVSKVFHFTYSLRYTYGFTILLLISGAIGLNQIQSVSKKAILLNSGVQFVILTMTAIVWPLLQGCSLTTPEVKLASCAILLLVLYTIFLLQLCKNSKQRNNKIPRTFLFSLMICEACFFGNYAITGQCENAQAYASYIDTSDDYQTTYRKLKNYDNSVYRIQLISSGLNDGLVYDIPTTTAYDSVYEYSLHDFLQWIRQYPDVSWSFNVDVPDLDPLLNVRYILLENATPEQIGYYKYWADQIDLDTPLTVLKLKEPTSFARTVTNISTKALIEPYQDETIPLNGLLVELKDTVVVESDDYEQLQSLLSDQTLLYEPYAFEDNAWSISLCPGDKDYLLFVAQSYDSGWSYHNQNGVALQSYKVQGGFTALNIPADTTMIHAEYTVSGLTTGIVVSTLSLSILIIGQIIQANRFKKQKGSFIS